MPSLQNTSSSEVRFPSGLFNGMLLEQKQSALAPAAIANLKPKHLEIVSLHLAGFRNKDIAKRLGCASQTVVNVLQSDAARDVIVAAMERYYTDFMELAPSAVSALRDSLQDESNPDLRLRAAGMWFKGAGWEQRERTGTAEAEVRQILIQAENVQLNG